MKKKYSYKISFLITILTTIMALWDCRKSSPYTANPIPPPDTTINASVAGLVTDLCK